MNKYIRTNDDGEKVLDYTYLDIAARVNFLNDAERAAAAIELDLDDPDFSNAEKAEAINSAANFEADNAFAYLETPDGESAQVDKDTRVMYVETIISELAKRYSVEVA